MDADQARQEAEARRQRIIQEANDRLSLVTGEKPKDDTEAAASTKLSGSARLAAMRKRRFKNKAKTDGDADDEAAAEEKTASTGETVEEAPVCKAEEAPATSVEEPIDKAEPAGLTENTTPASDKEASIENESAVAEDKTIKASEESSNRNQKKYMGVARMRRQKLKERQDAEHDANQATSLESIISSDKVAAVVARKKKKVHLLPILMHFVTTLLLFLAGFDVGWQQNQVLMANVHTEVAPRQLGLNILKRGSNKLLDKFHSLSGDSFASEPPLVAEDEFGDLAANNDEPVKENIDPIFRVDLDKLTEEDTIINYFARAAIFVHRSILKVILMPKTFASNLISGFAQLLTIPPLLCLVALFIRQFVGKVILGAKLPDIKPPDESEGKDVLSMGKNFVKGFITKAFPKVFSIYDAWSHLRTDMFVVLCGLITGFTLQYQLQALPLSTRLPAEEIVVVHAPPTEPSVEDMATTTGDEL